MYDLQHRGNDGNGTSRQVQHEYWYVLTKAVVVHDDMLRFKGAKRAKAQADGANQPYENSQADFTHDMIRIAPKIQKQQMYSRPMPGTLHSIF